MVIFPRPVPPEKFRSRHGQSAFHKIGLYITLRGNGSRVWDIWRCHWSVTYHPGLAEIIAPVGGPGSDVISLLKWSLTPQKSCQRSHRLYYGPKLSLWQYPAIFGFHTIWPNKCNGFRETPVIYWSNTLNVRDTYICHRRVLYLLHELRSQYGPFQNFSGFIRPQTVDH